MTTISVPLSPELLERLDSLVVDGVGSSRADVMRQALECFIEEEAVRYVLKAESEAIEGKVIRGSARTVLGS